MVYAPSQHSVAKFTNFQAAEQTVNTLKNAGFSSAHLSIVALRRDEEGEFDEASFQSKVENEVQERVTGATLAGTLLGAVGGCLAGLGFLTIPGMGLVFAVGTAQATLAGIIAGAGIGATGGGLLETLTCKQLARQQALLELSCPSRYEYLVLVEEPEAEARRAEAIVRQLYQGDDLTPQQPKLAFQRVHVLSEH
jgi:hypothetical protein